MIVKVENAAFHYDAANTVFENASFTVKKGEILSILGPNGCGKTTLLKCLNGLFPLKKGDIYVGDMNLNSLKRSDISKKIGYVPQKHNGSFPYSVFEMVLMGRASHLGLFSSPSAKDAEIAWEALESLGISHLADKPYPRISGGEAQLVLIARALTSEPIALLLDEPTSHLDFKNQKVILNVLHKLSKEKNIAVIMTTHFPDHALSISDKAMLMGNGKTGIVGNTPDVITEHNLKNLFEVDVRILSYDVGNNNLKTVVTL
ncbi:MAG: putative ABC transporter ATP-binding protein [Syntrophorhabdus sp. PtaU1.Bin050]|nr:MAG: putative ABC transporter ATP-binding protein [Syntrophorhabdus sp. PtaU1.Bin050]